MKLKAPLILASGSPRRHDLLRQAGFTFEVIVREVDEDIPEGLHPNAIAVYLSELKAKAYHDLGPDKIIITADTIVVLEGEVLGKPRDEAEAFEMLKRLSGNTHKVISGVTITFNGKFHSFAEVTTVTFAELDDTVIRNYIKKDKPFDKAGSYGIQDFIGMVGISSISGDFYNVMGLPVCRLYQELMAYR